jgi:DNA-binding HxlR family transcriptional regulator
MQRKSLGASGCPVARSLDHVGEWWNVLILRDAFLGISRFDDFQRSLSIAPSMLKRRLDGLIASGLMERRPYSEKPKRDEYVLTERGLDFRPVLWALMSWGNRHFAPEGLSVVLVDSRTGVPAQPVLTDARTGARMQAPDYVAAAGPAASPALRRRYARHVEGPVA